MSLDDTYYRKLHSDMLALLLPLRGRFTPEQVQLLDELIDVNEPGVALQILSEVLAKLGQPVPQESIEMMTTLAARMRLRDVLATIDQIHPE